MTLKSLWWIDKSSIYYFIILLANNVSLKKESWSIKSFDFRNENLDF